MSRFRASASGNIPDAIIRYYRLNRRDLVYLKFILEAYEGMSTLSTVDSSGVVVRLSVPAGFDVDMQDLMNAIRRDILIEDVTLLHSEEQHA